MKRLLTAATLPMLALLGACGGNDISTTNDNNVVLNDSQDNYAFTNDGEMPANGSDTMSGSSMDGMNGNAAMPANGMDSAPMNESNTVM